ncbi:MAG TPA: molybdenum cofactor guanylyltransferase MobA [Herbaspirillum sp.]|jgi:molybdenum cofactor guanylyltransferase|nr:molybdenum cofactor guanylyltransferase MobA [Herbaspirillum sp.]
MIPAVAITGLILAGGRGTRMGHVDKGLQTFRGLPLAAHAIARLAPQVGTLAININRNHAQYAPFGLPLWPDTLPDFAGPLAGLQAGLSRCTTPYLLSVPCDSPLLPLDLAARLSAALESTDADLALAVTSGDDGQIQRHPVFCLMKTTVLPQLNDYLRDGGRKMENWMTTLAMIDVHFDDHAAFDNLNTLQQLQQLEQRPL